MTGSPLQAKQLLCVSLTTEINSYKILIYLFGLINKISNKQIQTDNLKKFLKQMIQKSHLSD